MTLMEKIDVLRDAISNEKFGSLEMRRRCEQHLGPEHEATKALTKLVEETRSVIESLLRQHWETLP